VASLPAHILDNQELLEGFTLEAFEQAAGVNAVWILMPLRGRKRAIPGHFRQRGRGGQVRIGLIHQMKTE
jgi:hypothetical protein